ncbi:hypothetical protein [Paractinoplanes durhamensis]|uniref:Uncharacterized protein n=1 Tax=Paractinoplanes durhamensis TaxID=113563 RepID=A0ABQ3YY95_9ACTN|nr:hypothetical protein [Actinoplanes durhamensis]GIE02537.1 hypothetical protein Adu01nite_38870 [Actinoplanes durhamensis]
MTSQPQPTPGEGRSAGQYLRPLRDLAAYALIGATAVLLFVALVRLVPDGPDQFGYRTQGSFGGFINLATIAFPIAAVLLSLFVAPQHPKAQLVVAVAVVEYAVMAVFGLLFGVLIGLINEAAHNGARSAFEGLLERLAWLAVFAVAAYATFLIWRNLFYTPRPKPQPGVYGQPQFNQPGTYPGQPGYGPPPGQQGPGQQPYGPPPGQNPGQQAYNPAPQGGYPPAPGQPGYAAPGMYGQPPQPPTWNQAPVTMPTAPASAAPSSEPTQMVRPVERAPEAPIEDRTQRISDDRPGFGPADQDPPRQ